MPPSANRRLASGHGNTWRSCVLGNAPRCAPLARDAYGRTVANVRCGRTDVAAAQVGAGMAWVYTPYASAHPHLARLQQQARASRKGLWAQPRPLAPWSYRQRHQR